MDITVRMLCFYDSGLFLEAYNSYRYISFVTIFTIKQLLELPVQLRDVS